MKASWFIALCLCLPGWSKVTPLSIDKLREFQKEPCTLVHPWAAWCSICVQELPGLLPRFEAWKGAKVVVLDVSNPFTQEQFSKKWNVLKESGLKTYLRPGGVDAAVYQAAIDPDWVGSLPHSVLYVRGLRKKSWDGATDFEVLKKEVEKLCR